MSKQSDDNAKLENELAESINLTMDKFLKKHNMSTGQIIGVFELLKAGYLKEIQS